MCVCQSRVGVSKNPGRDSGVPSQESATHQVIAKKLSAKIVYYSSERSLCLKNWRNKSSIYGSTRLAKIEGFYRIQINLRGIKASKSHLNHSSKKFEVPRYGFMVIQVTFALQNSHWSIGCLFNGLDIDLLPSFTNGMLKQN